MEQFKQIGEVVGGMKALMIFQEDIQINQQQCCLLVDMFFSAYRTVAEQMKQNLKFDEKNTKWKLLENPLMELLRIFREGEIYIRQCMEPKDWWAKAIALHQNTDCIEFHIHNLLSYIPVVIEAIEMAGEIAGCDQHEMQKKKSIYMLKYHKYCKDPRIFQWKFGNQYLVSQDFCNRIDSAWEEDRWILLKRIQEKKNAGSSSLTKQEQRLADLLLKNLSSTEPVTEKLFPSSTLVGSKDYQVRRRLGSGSQYKEIQWLGESFALRHFHGDIQLLLPDISKNFTLSHPNIMHILFGFTDEEKKECFLVMELMSKDLSGYIKEVCGPRKRVPFSLPVAVDIMLQIARGMEYLHAMKIYHGDLNPSNILIKLRNNSPDGYLHVKVSGFGLTSSMNLSQKNQSTQCGQHSCIWYSPEVLAEQEHVGNSGKLKYTEKSDVYSFGMVCFELLTGKVPFEDGHLQGDKVSRNIRAGERPLFPFHSPKYLTNLTKKCWHADPDQRPSFLSICRILRYIKRFLVMYPDHSQPDPHMPPVDYIDIETGIMRSLPLRGNSNVLPVSEIPFQMFAYRVTEKEKLIMAHRETSESGSDGASAYGDEIVMAEDPFQSPRDPFPSPREPFPSPRDTFPSPREPFPSPTGRKSISSPENMKRVASSKKLDTKSKRQPVTAKGRSVRPPQLMSGGRSMRMNSESQLMLISPRPRRISGHASDSELS